MCRPKRFKVLISTLHHADRRNSFRLQPLLLVSDSHIPSFHITHPWIPKMHSTTAQSRKSFSRAFRHSRLRVVSASHRQGSCIVLFRRFHQGMPSQVTRCRRRSRQCLNLRGAYAYCFHFLLASGLLQNSGSPRKTDRAAWNCVQPCC